MPRAAQSTLHVCNQGWTYFASWAGVSVAHLWKGPRGLAG